MRHVIIAALLLWCGCAAGGDDVAEATAEINGDTATPDVCTCAGTMQHCTVSEGASQACSTGCCASLPSEKIPRIIPRAPKGTGSD